jgi:2Fe-2S ferredoxin
VEVSRKTLNILSEKSGRTTTVEFSDTINLLDLLNARNFDIPQACGGNGTCTTCRVFVHSKLSSVSQRTELEKERAEERNFSENERLSCQCELLDNVEISVPNGY